MTIGTPVFYFTILTLLQEFPLLILGNREKQGSSTEP